MDEPKTPLSPEEFIAAVSKHVVLTPVTLEEWTQEWTLGEACSVTNEECEACQ